MIATDMLFVFVHTFLCFRLVVEGLKVATSVNFSMQNDYAIAYNTYCFTKHLYNKKKAVLRVTEFVFKPFGPNQKSHCLVQAVYCFITP